MKNVKKRKNTRARRKARAAAIAVKPAYGICAIMYIAAIALVWWAFRFLPASASASRDIIMAEVPTTMLIANFTPYEMGCSIQGRKGNRIAQKKCKIRRIWAIIRCVCITLFVGAVIQAMNMPDGIGYNNLLAGIAGGLSIAALFVDLMVEFLEELVQKKQLKGKKRSYLIKAAAKTALIIILPAILLSLSPWWGWETNLKLFKLIPFGMKAMRLDPINSFMGKKKATLKTKAYKVYTGVLPVLKKMCPVLKKAFGFAAVSTIVDVVNTVIGKYILH